MSEFAKYFRQKCSLGRSYRGSCSGCRRCGGDDLGARPRLGTKGSGKTGAVPGREAAQAQP
jgi:hypothetical protein